MRISILALCAVSLIDANGQSVDIRDGFAQLPTVVRVPVKRVLYQSPVLRTDLMGDGFYAYVAELAPEDLTAFVDQYAQNDRRWTKGSLEVYRLYGWMLDWLEGWMKSAKLKSDIEKVVSLKELREAKMLYIRAEYKEKPMEGKSRNFTDVTLWMIDPATNRLVMFHQST